MMTLHEVATRIMTLRDPLACLVLPANEWGEAAQYVHPTQIIPATVDRPAYFWCLDHRVMTPATARYLGEPLPEGRIT